VEGVSREVLILDWLMTLSDDLARQFLLDFDRFEKEETVMPYVTSVERMHREDALQEGLQKGRQEGEQTGREKLLEVVRRLLARGESIQEVADITGLSPETVKSQARAMKRVSEAAAPYGAESRQAPATRSARTAKGSKAPRGAAKPRRTGPEKHS
jgi:DNA-directed RNA polymerase specialized sigma24 family protein